ncbi:hypothetical protein BN1232_06422 [Mycobacterium lentiflavum]|uniref:Uncharacterized protein n=1 Tax=Mycobacterium lentiflavum TaxID=141349 RepID=A0A0E4CRP7_MYCLN|nr:hypothetical protein BN1232_06422 [Mycobacterium lentiflavum]
MKFSFLHQNAATLCGDGSEHRPLAAVTEHHGQWAQIDQRREMQRRVRIA